MSVTIPIVAMGLATGLVSGTVSNSLYYLMQGHRMGRGIGITSGVINLCFFCNPIIMELLRDGSPDKDSGYFWVTRFSLSLAILGLFFSVWVYI